MQASLAEPGGAQTSGLGASSLALTLTASSETVTVEIESGLDLSAMLVSGAAGEPVTVGFVPVPVGVLVVVLVESVELLLVLVLVESSGGGVGFVAGAVVAVVVAVVGVVALVHLLAVGDPAGVGVLEATVLQVVLLVLVEAVAAGSGLLLGGLLGSEVVVASLPVVVETFVVEASLGFVVVELLLRLDVLVGIDAVALLVDSVELGLFQALVNLIEAGAGFFIESGTVLSFGILSCVGVVSLVSLLSGVLESLLLLSPFPLSGVVGLNFVLKTPISVVVVVGVSLALCVVVGQLVSEITLDSVLPVSVDDISSALLNTGLSITSSNTLTDNRSSVEVLN